MPYYYQSSSRYYADRKKIQKLLVAGSFMVGGNAGDVAPLIALKQFFENQDLPLAIEVLSSSSSSYDSFDCFYFLEQLNADLIRYLCEDAKLLMVIGGGAFFGMETVLQLRVFIEQLKMKTALFCIGTDYKSFQDEEDLRKKLLLKDLLKDVYHLSTRARFSQATCLSMGITPTEPDPLGDVVYMMDTMPGFYHLKEGFTIGVNLRWLWQESPFFDYMAALLDALVEKKKAKIVFLPFSFRNDPDTFAHEAIVKKMKHKNKTLVVQRHIYPPHLQDIISQMDLLIGMRLHANVMAYNVQTPFIGIDYHPKVQAFFEEVGLPNQVLLEGDKLNKTFNYGYPEPTQYPEIEDSLAKIEAALLKTPALNPKLQRKKVEECLLHLIKDSFSFGS